MPPDDYNVFLLFHSLTFVRKAAATTADSDSRLKACLKMHFTENTVLPGLLTEIRIR